MRRSRLLESRFRNVYLGLLTLWAAASLAFSIFANVWLVPRIDRNRADQIESLVRSHRESIELNNTRGLRDELLQSGVISDDRDFRELKPASDFDGQTTVETTLRSCHFVTTQTCVNSSAAIILSDPLPNGSTQVSFAVLLHTPFFDVAREALLWKLLAALILGGILGVVAWAIRKQEQFLLSKISLLAASLSRVESLFSQRIDSRSHSEDDEFSVMSQSIEQAGELLETKTRQIAKYKQQFEKRTKLDQLSQTISYSSHNLKAPLQESVNFLQDLPEFIESMPKDRLLRAIDSLQGRLQVGLKTLEEALQLTREHEARPHSVRIRNLLEQFQARIEANPNLSSSRIELDSSACPPHAEIHCIPTEIDGALWNLFKNSLEAKRNSFVTIRAVVEKSEAVIHFEDDGPGIPEPIHEKVFEDLFTTKSNGTGLGLASVKSVLERARGSIRALPAENGAHFEIRLPLTTVTEGRTNA